MYIVGFFIKFCIISLNQCPLAVTKSTLPHRYSRKLPSPLDKCSKVCVWIESSYCTVKSVVFVLWEKFVYNLCKV